MKAGALCLLLLSLISTAQLMDPPVVEWVRDYFPGQWATFRSIAETDDGGLIATMSVASDTSYSCHKLDVNGNIIWSGRSNLDNQGGRIAEELPDGSFIVAGFGRGTPSSSTALMIGKYSSNGQEIWTKLYDSSYPGSEIAQSISRLPDGGFAICGKIDPAEGMDQAWVLRTDSQGDTLWTREWGWQYNDKALTVLHIDDGLTVLMHGSPQSPAGGPYLVRYSMEGDLLWELPVDYNWPAGPDPHGQDMCEASDDGLLIMDYYTPTIVHTDYYGVGDWGFNPPGAGSNYGWCISTTMDGGILFGGENKWAEPGSEISGMLSRHNADGTELWRDYVDDLGCVAIYSACQLSQGGYLAAGYNGHGFLIKYAPELGIEEPDPAAIPELTVFPNPFRSVLSVSFTLPEPGISFVRVYDLSGRLVSTVTSGSFPAGTSTVEWVVPEELSSGCYLIQYNCDAGSIAEPVLLIK